MNSPFGSIASTMTSILSRLNDRFYLTFPGYDTKLGVGLPWDGKTHKLVLRIDKDDQDAQEVVMVPPWDPPKKPSSARPPENSIVLTNTATRRAIRATFGAKLLAGISTPTAS